MAALTDIRDPSAAQLARAAHEVFIEDHPGLVEGDYAEHPSAWIRHGSDDGPMCVIDISRNRSARFEQWTNQDCESEVARPLYLALPDEGAAVRLWTLLVAGDLDAVRGFAWQPSPHEDPP